MEGVGGGGGGGNGANIDEWVGQPMAYVQLRVTFLDTILFSRKQNLIMHLLHMPTSQQLLWTEAADMPLQQTVDADITPITNSGRRHNPVLIKVEAEVGREPDEEASHRRWGCFSNVGRSCMHGKANAQAIHHPPCQQGGVVGGQQQQRC